MSAREVWLEVFEQAGIAANGAQSPGSPRVFLAVPRAAPAGIAADSGTLLYNDVQFLDGSDDAQRGPGSPPGGRDPGRAG
jgi:hypothetical protein